MKSIKELQDVTAHASNLKNVASSLQGERIRKKKHRLLFLIWPIALVIWFLGWILARA